MRTELTTFMHGGLVCASLVIALRFVHYRRLSGDRIFSWFAGAFLMFAAGWTARALDPMETEHAHLVFLPRLFGFLMIVVAILDKNRVRTHDRRHQHGQHQVNGQVPTGTSG